MGNVFSFYQYDGTGAPGCVIYSGDPPNRVCIWEGPILPTTSPWYSQFTGFYVPLAVIEGRKVGFLWRLYDDFESRSPTYRTKFSGEAGNRNNELFSFGLELSGNVSTLITDSGTYELTFTGAQVSGIYEIATYNTTYSGFLLTGEKDVANFSTLFSGDYVAANRDVASFISVLSGLMNPPVNETFSYVASWSGSFSRKDKDSMGFNCTLSEVSYEIGGKLVTISGEDAVGTNLTLSQVIYEFR